MGEQPYGGTAVGVTPFGEAITHLAAAEPRPRGTHGLGNAGPRRKVFLEPELPHADGGSMITSYRPFIALALLAVGLAIFLVDNVSLGWTGIGVFGVLCLVLAIAAQLLAIRKHRAHN